MFATVSRRLAILNAAVVIAVIALVGLGTALTLRRGLDREESHLLRRRAEAAASSWSDRVVTGAATPSPVRDIEDDGDEGDEEEEGKEAHEALSGGDVVLYGVNTEGLVTVNERGFTFPELPDQSSVQAALAGGRDERIVTVNGERVRLVSVPVRAADGSIVGAVQAARSESLYANQLRIAIYASLAGIILGAIVAPVSGLFLARRAMRPINAAFDRQRAFVSDASHELRTPLAVIRANVELIQRMPEASPVEIDTETGRVLDEIDGMTRLVNDLLFLARMDEGDQGLLAHDQVSMADLVSAETAVHQQRATGSGLTLTAMIATNDLVMGDADRLRQVVRILLDNAIAYTPVGGSIESELTNRGSSICVRVKDTGIGISPEDQERVFDRFYRSSGARDRQSGGTGVGLAIAKSIVEAHHGSISVESKPGTGTRFTVLIPKLEHTSTVG